MTTSSMNRRKFISSTLKTGAALTLGSTLFQLSAHAAMAKEQRANLANINLVKDPGGICDLPEGFTYTIISKEGEPMSDGLPVPGNHDGMGCFSGPNGEIILVRNHEVSAASPSVQSSPAAKHAYDLATGGGTTTIWLNEALEVTKHHLSLTGTMRNCSGGITPWETWISSEEPGSRGWFIEKRHGYNFEVNPLNPLQSAEPLKAMGRFNHEAVAVDTASGIAYETEDNSNGCFYRFIPNELEHFEKGGVLQALKFVDENIRHTSEHPLELHKPYPCVWVTVDEPDPDENTVAKQAQEKGAAVFVRGEGIVAHSDGIYFSCTTGGKAKLGQFFKYIPDPNNDSGTIELVYESTEKGVIEKPDNITLNEWGDLIICEDNGLDTQCLIGLTPQGKVYYIASNSRSEWAGACFSPDGKTLFANIQKGPGVTVAIQGPWESLRDKA